MKYHRCVEEIFGSRAKIKILRALHRFPEKEFSSRELAKFIGLSHTAVLKASRELEGMNIILVRTHGRFYGIRLNGKSVLAELLDIFDAESKLIDVLVRELKGSFTDSVSVAIFGSIASGNEEPHSDIDLLVVAENKNNAEKEASAAQRRIAEKFGNPISPYILAAAEFKGMKNTALIKNIIKNHVLVQGKKLEEI